jgi:hypothetical protein
VLARRGMDKKAIAEEMGCSLYTVRKAIEPDFAEQERARHRSFGAERHERRKGDPDYVAYQKAYSSTDEYRERVRILMAALRARNLMQRD